MRGTYYRWTGSRDPEDGILHADILGVETIISADPENGRVYASVPAGPMDPDTARMIGVRLIEAAVLADNGRSIREA